MKFLENLNKDYSLTVAKDIDSVIKACFVNVYRFLISNDLVKENKSFAKGVTFNGVRATTNMEKGNPSEFFKDIENFWVVLGFFRIGNQLLRHMWISTDEKAPSIIDPTLILTYKQLEPIAEEADLMYIPLVTMSLDGYKENLEKSKRLSLKNVFLDEEMDFVRKAKEMGFVFDERDYL